MPKLPSLFKTAAFSLTLATLSWVSTAHAVRSAELFTTDGYQFGRFEARIQFAYGDGIVSSFFLWKDGSEQSGIFWNELDFEKVGADCELQTNALYGDPERVHADEHEWEGDLCGTFHTYVYEWTPEYIAWFIDGVEIRRDTGEDAAAYSENTAEGMQFRFNIWPGDASFGGNFDPAILPVHQYINWVQYSSYEAGEFQLQWREDFSGTSRPSGWAVGSWESPKQLSTHSAANVNFINGYAVLSLTADDATGSAGAAPLDPDNVEPEVVDPVPTTTGTATGTATAPNGTVAMPGTPGVEPMSDSGEGGCSVHAPATRRTHAGAWLTLACGLLLTRARRRKRVQQTG